MLDQHSDHRQHRKVEPRGPLALPVAARTREVRVREQCDWAPPLLRVAGLLGRHGRAATHGALLRGEAGPRAALRGSARRPACCGGSPLGLLLIVLAGAAARAAERGGRCGSHRGHWRGRQQQRWGRRRVGRQRRGWRPGARGALPEHLPGSDHPHRAHRLLDLGRILRPERGGVRGAARRPAGYRRHGGERGDPRGDHAAATAAPAGV
mmetsp:Transcript_167457/g.537761  ORF Transcript_167457/g.537761 Transcript_167457/m.537761 type:complete len:209 (-) Transcript_167457:544-1170(-)